MDPTVVTSKARALLAVARNVRHYERLLSAAQGEGFNLFKILRIGHYEVQTHSPLLAELLNPQGAHGQGAVFLQHFLTRLSLVHFIAEAAEVSTEVHAPPQTEEEGGRIDIRIRDSKGAEILIENKIYAGLQPDQLTRYRKSFPQGTLFYLTLNGEAPDETVHGSVPGLVCISYRDDILGWLQDCRKEAVAAPCVRETITQYIHLIQELTQQNTSARMNQELIKAVLHDEETLLAYTALYQAKDAVRTEIIKGLRDDLRGRATVLGLEMIDTDPDPSKKFMDLMFGSPQLAKSGLGICFEFGKTEYRGCYFGFYRLDEDKQSPIEPELQKSFKLKFKGIKDPTKLWPAWDDWKEHFDWTESTFAAIQFGQFKNQFGRQLEGLMAVFDEACKAANFA